MPRPKLTQEEIKERKRLNDKKYYERHRDEIRQRQRMRYSPEARQEAYNENFEEISKRRQEQYQKQKSQAFKERLDDLKTILDLQLTPIVDYLIETKKYEKLYHNELTLLENILMLSSEYCKKHKEDELREQLTIILPQNADC